LTVAILSGALVSVIPLPQYMFETFGRNLRICKHCKVESENQSTEKRGYLNHLKGSLSIIFQGPLYNLFYSGWGSIDTVLLQFVLQGAAVDAEDLSGPGAVAACFGERFDDQFLFHRFQADPVRDCEAASFFLSG
jgi:hypothetical protein